MGIAVKNITYRMIRRPCFWSAMAIAFMWLAFYGIIVGWHSIKLDSIPRYSDYLWEQILFMVYALGVIVSTACLYADGKVSRRSRCIFMVALYMHFMGILSYITVEGENAIPLLQLGIFLLSGIVLGFESLVLAVSAAVQEFDDTGEKDNED